MATCDISVIKALIPNAARLKKIEDADGYGDLFGPEFDPPNFDSLFLFYAIETGRMDVVEYLVDVCKADPTQENCDLEKTPIIEAAETNQIKMLAFFMEKFDKRCLKKIDEQGNEIDLQEELIKQFKLALEQNRKEVAALLLPYVSEKVQLSKAEAITLERKRVEVLESFFSPPPDIKETSKEELEILQKRAKLSPEERGKLLLEEQKPHSKNRKRKDETHSSSERRGASPRFLGPKKRTPDPKPGENQDNPPSPGSDLNSSGPQ